MFILFYIFSQMIDDASENEYKDLASELKILIHLGEHKHIVNLLGACTTSGKLFVILEFCSNGNLLSYLRARREIFQAQWSPRTKDSTVTYTYTDLVHVACQISEGMEFLQSKKVSCVFKLIQCYTPRRKRMLHGILTPSFFSRAF